MNIQDLSEWRKSVMTHIIKCDMLMFIFSVKSLRHLCGGWTQHAPTHTRLSGCNILPPVASNWRARHVRSEQHKGTKRCLRSQRKAKWIPKRMTCEAILQIPGGVTSLSEDIWFKSVRRPAIFLRLSYIVDITKTSYSKVNRTGWILRTSFCLFTRHQTWTTEVVFEFA